MPKRTQASRRQPSAEHRQRVYAACVPCRRRKRKCDGLEPCSSCASYGYHCTYGEMPAENAETAPAIRSRDDISRPGSNAAAGPSPRPAASASSADSPANLVINKERGRFICPHSAVALPYLVGRELAAENPPRLHSFAWNLGIRQEEKPPAPTPLSHYLTLDECRRFSTVYFAAVHPLFAFLSQDAYWVRLEQQWPRLANQDHFAAIVAGVVALGSFFSQQSHPQEESIKKYCFSILDLALSTPVSMVTMDSVSGWILRTLYVRLTTRPAIACLSIHTAMHMVDILSLHRDIAESSTVGVAGTARFTPEEIDTRHRHYWVAWSLNCLLSVEYGISPVRLHFPTNAPIISTPGVHIQHFVSIGQLLGAVDEALKKGVDSQDMTDQFVRLAGIQSDAAVVSLFKADVCLSMLRRFIPGASRPNAEVSTASVAVLKQALAGITELLRARHPWWNILGVPFQTVCMCLYVDTRPYLEILATAIEVLRSTVQVFESHMAKEALNTALQLVAASRDRTASQMKLKDTILGDSQPSADVDWLSLGQGYDIMESWPLGLDFDLY